MTKRLEAKKKLARRYRANLWGDPTSSYNIRPHAPGQHGAAKKTGSDFAIQLRAKQMLKFYYGSINERQFRNIFREARRIRGNTSEKLVDLLERRVDAIVYRAKWAPTVFAARQLVNHGHIKLNGKKHNIGSARVKDGDVLELVPAMRQNEQVLLAGSQQERDVPSYLDLDAANFKVTFRHSPKLEDVPYGAKMEPGLVVELYSR